MMSLPGAKCGLVVYWLGDRMHHLCARGDVELYCISLATPEWKHGIYAVSEVFFIVVRMT